MTYLAFLRGINVGGHHRVEMARLRSAFEALGFEKVRTLIQSGNVIFNAPKTPELTLCRRVEAKLSAEFGFPIPVIVRTVDEINKVVNSNPFLKQKGVDISRLHVVFLVDLPNPDALTKFESLASASEQVRCIGRELYLYLPNGFGKTKLTPNVFHKSLSVSATSRNWNTTKKLCELSNPQT
jgi:uncharacterized protein (DUF1697 family)